MLVAVFGLANTLNTEKSSLQENSITGMASHTTEKFVLCQGYDAITYRKNRGRPGKKSTSIEFKNAIFKSQKKGKKYTAGEVYLYKSKLKKTTKTHNKNLQRRHCRKRRST